MIDINVPIHKIMEFGGQNQLYTVIGVGGFLFTTVGSMMVKCMINNRKNKKKLLKHQDEMKKVTEKVLQDAVKSHNIAIMEDVPIDKSERGAGDTSLVNQPFQVVDKIKKVPR